MSKNWATSTVATAPSPATTGTSLVVAAGQGVRFTRGFATVNPATTEPTPLNAELVFVDVVATDTLTIVRSQESSTARAIVVGDEIRMGLPAGQWDRLGGFAYNVKGFGAKCDDTADDSAAVQAAVTACAAAGGGTVLIPGKCYLGATTITVPSLVRLMGTGRENSWLRKASGSGAIMLDFSGTATGYNTHNHLQGLSNISLKGSASSGTLLRLYYVDNFHAEHVYFHDSTGKMVDALELWDSYFSQCTWLTGGGTGLAAPGSTTSAPMVHLRNGIAPSGFGSSTDNCNMVWFEQCRWEDFADGALWVELGANGVSNPNGIFVTQAKFETHRVRAIPIVTADQCAHVHFDTLDVVLGNFDTAGTPATTPVTAYLMGGYSHTSVRDARFVVSDAQQSMANGIEAYGTTGPLTIDGISHEGLNPTNAVVAIGGAFGVMDIGTIVTNASATLISGTPTNTTYNQASGPMPFAAVATPTAADAGTVKLFARSVAGRILPAIIGPAGLDTSLQPLLGRNRVVRAQPVAGTTTVSSDGVTLTATGTATIASPASTNLHTSLARLDYLVTVAATTAVAGFRSSVAQFWRGNAAGLGGFFYICRWSPATGQATTTARAFCGLAAATAAPTDVEPSSQVSMLGMGWDAADAQIQMMGNDATGTATKTALGASFAVPTTDRPGVYELAMFAPPNGANVQWLVTNVGTGATASGTISAAADLPASTTFLAPRAYCSVGGTSSVIGLTLFGLYIECDT